MYRDSPPRNGTRQLVNVELVISKSAIRAVAIDLFGDDLELK